MTFFVQKHPKKYLLVLNLISQEHIIFSFVYDQKGSGFNSNIIFYITNTSRLGAYKNNYVWVWTAKCDIAVSENRHSDVNQGLSHLSVTQWFRG